MAPRGRRVVGASPGGVFDERRVRNHRVGAPALRSTIAPLSLRRNFAWTLLGNAFYAASQWGMLIVIAKLGTPEQVGMFALALAICAPAILLTNLDLRGIQATDAKQEFRFHDYLGLRSVTSLLSLLVVAAITLLAGFPRRTQAVILAVAVAKGLESLSDVFYGLFQKHERMDRVATSMMLKGALSLPALATGLYLTRSVFWGVVGLGLAWGLLLVGYDMINGNALLKSQNAGTSGGAPGHWLGPGAPWPSRRIMRKLAWLAAPLGLSAMLTSLVGNIPRYFIESALGERELGIFAALAYFIMLGAMVSGALGQSASPRLARYFSSGDVGAFRRLILRLSGLGAIGSALALLVTLSFGKQILQVAYTQEYADRSGIFSWLMLATGIAFVSGFLTYGLTAARFLRVQVWLNVGIGVLTLISSALLIPGFGLLGAAWVTCVFYGAHLTVKGLILVVISRRRSAGGRGPAASIPPCTGSTDGTI